MPSIALLANPDSGGGDAEGVEGLLRDAGAEVSSFAVADHERAASAGADRLAVAGGDGSIACAAASAAAAGLPLAVIATGTANDFAAGLGLPADIDEACQLAVRGAMRREMELAWVGDRPFVNVASVGLAPTAAEHADELKGRLGALAYIVGAVRAGVSAHPVRCRVGCDGGERFSGKAWQVSVASTGVFGGGSTLDANSSDGKLDLVVIEGGSRIHLVKHAYGLRIGSVEGQRGVIDERCSTIELRLDGEESLNVDGELLASQDLAEEGIIRFRAERDAFELIVG